MGLIFMGFTWYSQKEAVELQAAKVVRDSIERVEIARKAALNQIQTNNTSGFSANDAKAAGVASNSGVNAPSTLEPALISALSGEERF